MSWSWHWWVFIVALIPCVIVVQFFRGAMNSANVVKYGRKADYRADPAGAFVGSILAGAVYAAIITAIAGQRIGVAAPILKHPLLSTEGFNGCCQGNDDSTGRHEGLCRRGSYRRWPCERCAMHSDVFMSEYLDEDLLVEAYKITNARITKGEQTAVQVSS
jgi:hypothetical protein